ncbi:HAD family hydrolase [Sabulilitoribacter arenilitoris]|uniref:HAD family hydrolase n=1 Tax=Wocania arenilitoris TaxID=2044858 RepID=A0AAE3ENP2_9FLAO|nr:HAD family hydrolase [Wocania arenilitoris]MCF7568790.1 HAD family hydrolase [Wocania arenilitoris]
MKYKCVIFDCDGVLVDSEAISCMVLQEMADNLGLSLKWNTIIETFSGKSLRNIIEYIEIRINQKIPANFETEFRQKTFESFKRDLKPIKGIHKVINELTVPFCVASSGPRNKIILNLTTVDLIHKFSEERIFSSYDIGSWKPEPEIYLFAAKKMGFKPKECVVIEDSIYGIEAAISGGFDTYAYTKGHNKKKFTEMGAMVFNDMNQLNVLISH